MNHNSWQSEIHILAAILALVVTAGSCYSTEKVTYYGFTLFRAFPQREQHIAGLRALRAQECNGIEFWTEPSSVNKTVDIMVSPDQQDHFGEHLRHLRLPVKRIMHDVGEVIKRSNNMQIKAARILQDATDNSTDSSDRYFRPNVYYQRYQPYATMERKLEIMAKHPLVTLDVIGSSYEGRKLYLLKISTDPNAKKPVIFIDAGHHAREWTSHSTIMYLIESLLSEDMPAAKEQTAAPEDADKYGEDIADFPSAYSNKMSQTGKFRSFLEHYDFWFLPVVNPDGYEWSQTRDRLWRKTRSTNGRSCRGVDPNRNYAFYWGGKGTSSYPCAEIYAGPSALSEPETKALAKLIVQNKGRIAMYLTLHSFGGMILFPYGYDGVRTSNYMDLKKVAEAGARGFALSRGSKFTSDTSAILLYPAAGGSDDYAYEVGGAKYSFTIELAAPENYGFMSPPSEIIPVGQETVDGITYMINAMRSIESGKS